MKRIKDLPLGRGKGIIKTRKGERIRVNGRVILTKSKKKYLVVEKSSRQAFGPGTRVERWKRNEKEAKSRKTKKGC